MTAIRQPRPPRFEQESVDVSLLAIYLGLHLSGGASQPRMSELEGALIQAGQRDDHRGLTSLALSGMPQAIVAFHRRLVDIHLAASLMNDLGRASFRTADMAVDAGYFEQIANELRYVDSVSQGAAQLPEVLDPFRTRSLLNDLSVWTHRPCAEVLDSPQGDVLRLRPGTELFASHKLTDQARQELADKPQRATVSLLRAVPKSQRAKASSAPQVSRVALGQVMLVREPEGLLMRQPAPEFLLEMHAAALSRSSPGHALFLHVDLLSSQFLSPLPDLMQPGATAQGWWVPLRDITTGLGGSRRLTGSLPRGTAIALMQNTPWMWSDDLSEWVQWAWWLEHQGRSTSLSTSPSP